mgnify:CR=1 FL=1
MIGLRLPHTYHRSPNSRVRMQPACIRAHRHASACIGTQMHAPPPPPPRSHPPPHTPTPASIAPHALLDAQIAVLALVTGYPDPEAPDLSACVDAIAKLHRDAVSSPLQVVVRPPRFDLSAVADSTTLDLGPDLICTLLAFVPMASGCCSIRDDPSPQPTVCAHLKAYTS